MIATNDCSTNIDAVFHPFLVEALMNLEKILDSFLKSTSLTRKAGRLSSYPASLKSCITYFDPQLLHKRLIVSIIYHNILVTSAIKITANQKWFY